jgi:hypothetical protein
LQKGEDASQLELLLGTCESAASKHICSFFVSATFVITAITTAAERVTNEENVFLGQFLCAMAL